MSFDEGAWFCLGDEYYAGYNSIRPNTGWHMSKRNDQEFEQEDSPILQIVDEYIEEEEVSGKRVRRTGVYLLPNLFTTAALFSGFFAIVSGMSGNFAQAAMAIFAAQILDGFDGRVARMTNTTSAFGVQYDSLSDLVSFGLAPALVVFSWALEPLGKFGWGAAFVFCACAALRLARFNTQVDVVDKKYFVGLASPPAAAILAATVWCFHDVEVTHSISVVMSIITVLAGLLMVSNIRYTSFKELNLRRRVPFVVFFAGVLVIALVVVDPAHTLLVMAVTYCLSGPVMWGVTCLRGEGEQPKGDGGSHGDL